MNEDEIRERNMALLGEFMRYAFEHPDVLDGIPKGAHLVLLPEDDEHLKEENLRALARLRAQGDRAVVVRMLAPKPVIKGIDLGPA